MEEKNKKRRIVAIAAHGSMSSALQEVLATRLAKLGEDYVIVDSNNLSEEQVAQLELEALNREKLSNIKELVIPNQYFCNGDFKSGKELRRERRKGERKRYK